MSEPRFDELLRRLSEAGVRFVLVGGLAVNAWGVIRGTKDVDVVIATDADNLKKVASAAVACGGHVQRRDLLTSSKLGIAALLAEGEQVTIETELGRLDVVQGLDGVPAYEEMAKRSVETELLGVRVRVCSVDDLRAMKQAAGRHRDLADLEDLEASEG